MYCIVIFEDAYNVLFKTLQGLFFFFRLYAFNQLRAPNEWKQIPQILQNLCMKKFMMHLNYLATTLLCTLLVIEKQNLHLLIGKT